MAAPRKAPLVVDRRTIAELEAELEVRTIERDAALAREAAIAEALAQRNSEYSERIEQQAATIDVLKVMSASPGDPQPVFDLIAVRARNLCGAYGATVLEFDGTLIHHRASTGISDDPARREAVIASFPTTPAARPMTGRAILERRTIRIDDLDAVYDRDKIALPDVKSLVLVPMLRGESVIGVLSMGALERNAFSDTQVELLKTFSEQAVIAITSAKAHREQHEALEQQTATAEVLGVINSSPGNLAPVFEAMLEKALRLSGGAFGNLLSYDGDLFKVEAAVHRDGGIAKEMVQRAPFRPVPGGAPASMVEGQDVCFTEDLEKSPDYVAGHSEFRRMVDRSGYRSVLNVALRRKGVLLGTIGIFRTDKQPFTDKQIALLQNFAAQAVIAMENARLITETREALEQQTATAEVLGVINSSPGDLTPVFDAMLQRACDLCEAAFGQLWTYDGAHFEMVASRGVPPEYARFVRGPQRLGPGTAHGRIVAGENVVHIADLAGEEAYRSGDPHRRATVDVAGARSLLGIALRQDEQLLGVLMIYRQEVQPYSEKQIALLQNFAAQAVIAIENARLITETREALEQQTATAEVLQVINASPGNLAPVFDAMLEKAMRLCEADFGFFLRYQDARYSLAAGRGLKRAFLEYLSRMDQPGPNEANTRVIHGAPYVHIVDMRDDEPYRSGAPFRRAIVDLGGGGTGLGVPMRKDHDLLGTFNLARSDVRPFTEKQIVLVQNFAAQAVIAMENAQLITQTRDALEQQTATAEVLQVINEAAGNLQPVFDAILEKAHRLCGAAKGAFVTFDGSQLRGVATRGLSEPYAEMVRAQRDNPPGSPPDRLLKGERFVHIADFADLDLPIPRAAVELEGIHTVLFVPLRKQGGLLGYITAYRQEVKPFADDEIALLERFAAQAVIAMENARLLGELRQRTEEVAELNRGLEARVAEQVEELGRVGRLKRFLAPQLAELIVSQGDEKILESHRREIVVVFCDLRGYTAFTETAEPEEVLDFLREYHGALGPLVSQFEGTLDQFSGDGIMVFFNDPVPIPDAAERAVRMTIAMREAASTLISGWRRLGRDLGFGAGIAQGYATLGQIGFSERSGYTAIGTVCNVAARLCAEAKDGQILISQRVAARLDDHITIEDIGSLALKGLMQPVATFNVPLVAGQPAFRVIEGGPQSG